MNEVKQVEATAVWSVGFRLYLYFHNSNLFSLLSQFDTMYESFKGLLQTLFAPVWIKIRQYLSKDCS